MTFASYLGGATTLAVLLLDRATTLELTSGQWGERAGWVTTRLRPTVQILAWLAVVAWAVEGHFSGRP